GIEMTGAEVLDVSRDAIWTIVKVSSPLLIVGLVVGVAISSVQALTQIQEQTSVFVPKILAMFVTSVSALPFMADASHSQMMRISSSMRIDISSLPALAAAFMSVFARIGAMVMSLPGFGEANIPVRVRLAIASASTSIISPSHRNAYTVSMTSIAPSSVSMVQEIIIGVVLGATARVTSSASSVAGSVIAQQLGLGFVTTVDPTQGQQGASIGNFSTMLGSTSSFATDMHHSVIVASSESYNAFSPGELMSSGDV
ncbi:hypothetical protein OY671_008349, partial [Metschnikowia pulcherrima]